MRAPSPRRQETTAIIGRSELIIALSKDKGKIVESFRINVISRMTPQIEAVSHRNSAISTNKLVFVAKYSSTEAGTLSFYRT